MMNPREVMSVVHELFGHISYNCVFERRCCGLKVLFTSVILWKRQKLLMQWFV